MNNDARKPCAELPYSEADRERIAAALKRATDQRGNECVEYAQQAARDFVFQKRRKPQAPPRRGEEITAIGDKACELLEAIDAVSSEAQMCLFENSTADPRDDGLFKLRRAIDEFVGDHRSMLANPPRDPKGGGAPHWEERQLITQMRQAWRSAHHPENPQGFWKFFRACVEPLKPYGLASHLSIGYDEGAWRKAWEATERASKAHRERAAQKTKTTR